ncbi:hypothetical protein RvY_02075 [Ramazzottius varieornatus]|uniref:Uncharacterized protein n=1 Tax=Ramazzottius varieornatus TaxID=947166 RepID=A0A1D1UPF8_RAMVA|nr:hypothetical protein RvY_02075 [Ramazzottius varieornatus]
MAIAGDHNPARQIRCCRPEIIGSKARTQQMLLISMNPLPFVNTTLGQVGSSTSRRSNPSGIIPYLTLVLVGF